MKTKAHEVFEEIKALINLRFDDLQTFKSMYHTFEVGESAIVSGSEVILISKTKDHLQFKTFIQPGADRGYAKHWHDCKEVCTVLEGQMADLAQMHKTAQKGQHITYEPFQEHMPYNPGKETLVLQVDFYRSA